MISTIEHYPATIDQATGEIIDPSVDAYGFEITPTGLHAAREITLRDWGNAWDMLTGEYKRLERKATWIQFAIGDLLVFGENKFGEQIWDFIDSHDYDIATVRNFKSVAKNVDVSRRNENLTFKHHTAVAALSPHEQTEWLDRAQSEHLSANALYEQTKAKRGIAPAHLITCPNCAAQFEI